MSVIIRLQNLPWSANAADIRQYFQGLSIPEGGVHIVGGEKGDAFISFSTDEDARQAMLSDGGCIKEVQIRLLLSSRNEMQKVIETARQQTMQLTQVYMQQMQQPQLPIVMGSMPPLTAKVLPQPQQPQVVRPDHSVNHLRRQQQQPVMDSSAVQLISVQDKLQQLQHHLSPRSENNKDRDDKSGGHKRERTRSKSRDRRSKSSRSVGKSRDRSRSRDRRRRDRSRGRDRSKDKHRIGGGRDSSSRGRSHRSRSPVTNKAPDGKDQQQMTKFRPWTCQYDNNIQPQHIMTSEIQQQQTAAMNATGPAGSMYSQFRTPPQPPIVPALAPNLYQQQQQKVPNNDWSGAAMNERQQQQHQQQQQQQQQHQHLQPYVAENDFHEADVYGTGGGSDDEDDRQAEFDNNFHKRFNNGTSSGPGMRRGPPGQDFRGDQQQTGGFGGGPNSRGRGGGGGPPRYHRPSQSGMPNRGGGGGHRSYDEYGGGGGPGYNNNQHHPRYGGGVPDGGRPSRFSSIQDGGRPSRFNAAGPAQRRDENFVDNVKKSTAPRYNDRYRYDVRNAQAQPAQVDGLCVEVNNMSNHFSYGDVRKFFDGIRIDRSAIKIQKHRQGVAFVRFENNHNKNMAMQFNGTEYKGNQVVVKHLDDEAYERDNTDDRPYPIATAAVPTIVDHVDLVDDDEDDVHHHRHHNHNDQQSAGAVKDKDDRSDGGGGGDDDDDNNRSGGGDDEDDRSDDDDDRNQLVVCEKKEAASATTTITAGDGDEQQPTASQQQQQQRNEPPTKYLKLKQLPITVTEENVLSEFDGGDDVRRVTFYPDGEFMGAALEFSTVDAAEVTLKRFDCVLLGSTPVPVLRCTNSEYAQIKRKAGGGSRRFSADGNHRHHHQQPQPQQQQHQQQQHQQRRAPPPPHSSSTRSPPAAAGGGGMPLVPPPPPSLMPLGGRHQHHNNHHRSNCVFVYGLPTTVTNTDITQFFADTSVLPDKIHIMLNKFGRPTGESYCEFGTAQQAHAALAKDQCYMGPNLVYVEPIDRSNMIQAITKPMQQHNHQQDITSWAGGMRGGGPTPRQQHNNMMSSQRNRHHHNQGPPQSQSSYSGRPPQQQQYNMNNNGGGGGYAPRMRGPGLGPPNIGPDGFGQPGCVVALDNVPYRADVQEIVDFFDGFDLNIQNVIRRFNDFGKPTGEARVNLRNPQEAMRAVRMLQNKPIYNRPVRLTLL